TYRGPHRCVNQKEPSPAHVGLDARAEVAIPDGPATIGSSSREAKHAAGVVPDSRRRVAGRRGLSPAGRPWGGPTAVAVEACRRSCQGRAAPCPSPAGESILRRTPHDYLRHAGLRGVWRHHSPAHGRLDDCVLVGLAWRGCGKTTPEERVAHTQEV